MAKKDEDEKAAIIVELANEYGKSVDALGSLGIKGVGALLSTCRAMAAEKTSQEGSGKGKAAGDGKKADKGSSKKKGGKGDQPAADE